MRRTLLAAMVLVSTSCSHSPQPAEATPKADRRDDWLLALRSDVERIGDNDGFEGHVRVLHAGKAEIDRSFGEPGCFLLAAGRKLLAAVAVARLVEDRKLALEDRLERRLPSTSGTSFAPLTVANLLTDSPGLAATPGGSLDERLDAAGKVPLRALPGTLIDPAEDRPWLLV